MTKIQIEQLIWDDFNTEHIKKHNATKEEITAVTKHPTLHKVAKKGRYAVIGRTGTRILTIIVNRIKTKTYYVITARDAAKKERKQLYEKEKK